MKMKRVTAFLSALLMCCSVATSMMAIPVSAEEETAVTAIETTERTLVNTTEYPADSNPILWIPYSLLEYSDGTTDIRIDASQLLKVIAINDTHSPEKAYYTMKEYVKGEGWLKEDPFSIKYYYPDGVGKPELNYNDVAYSPDNQYCIVKEHVVPDPDANMQTATYRTLYFYNHEKKMFTMLYDEETDSCYGYPCTDGIVTIQGWYNDEFREMVSVNGVLPVRYELYWNDDNTGNPDFSTATLKGTYTPVAGERNPMEISILDYGRYFIKAVYDNTEEKDGVITNTSGNKILYFNGTKMFVGIDNVQVISSTKSILRQRDENGNIVETEYPEGGTGLFVMEEDAVGTSYLYKNAEIIGELSANDVNSGKYGIASYDDGATYFLKLSLDDKENNYAVYRYNKEKNTWELRVNTAETPTYETPVNITEFPDEDAKGSATGVETGGKKRTNWTKKEFNAGNVKIVLNLNLGKNDPSVTFDYGDDGTATYVYIGIDKVLKETTGKRAEGVLTGKTNIPTNADKGDKIVVDGKGEDGTPVHFEFVAEEDNPSIPLKDGTYVVTDETKKIQAEVIVDQDDSEKKEGSLGEDGVPNDGSIAHPVNLTDLEKISKFIVKTPDGNVLDEGKVHDGSFDNVDDMNVPEDKVRQASPYFIYEVKKGISNSSEQADDYETEEGYFTINEDGSLNFIDMKTGMLGDVNISRTVNVQDVIMLNKYLHKQVEFHIENYINADMNRDGKVNVIDLALLKKMLIEQ